MHKMNFLDLLQKKWSQNWSSLGQNFGLIDLKIRFIG